MERIGFRISIFLLLLSFYALAPLLPASSQYYDYLLLTYRNVSEPQLGSSFMIYAQVYQGTEVIENAEIHISSPNLEIEDGMMRIEKPGLFDYRVSLPLTYNRSSVSFHLIVYINGEMVAWGTHDVSIELPEESINQSLRDLINQNLEENAQYTAHSLNSDRLSPGETLEIDSYMPEMASGRIKNGSIAVTIWPDYVFGPIINPPKRWDSPLVADISATYRGKGAFATTWQIPDDLDLSYPSWNETVLEVRITTRGLDTHTRSYRVRLDAFFLSIQGKIVHNNLELNISAIDFELQPISGADLALRFEQEINLPGGDDMIAENRSGPATDPEGKSFYSYELNESCESVVVRTQVCKNGFIAVRTSQFTPDSDDSPERFSVLRKSNPLIDALCEEQEDMINPTFQARLGDTPISNTEITIYALWIRGIIAIQNYTTSKKGEFDVKIPYPSGITSNDEILVYFGYHNGSVWLYDEISLHPFYEEISSLSDGKDLSVSFEKKQLATIAKITVKVPTNCPFATLYAYPVFENSDSCSSSICWYTSFRNSTDGIPLNNRISCEIIYSASLTPRYFVVHADLADLSESWGYRELTWIIDSHGNVLSFKQQLGSFEARLASGVAVIGGIFAVLLMGMVLGYLGHVAVEKDRKKSNHA